MINFYPFLYRFGVSFNYEVSSKIITSLIEFIKDRYNLDINLTQEDDTYCSISIKDDEARGNTLVLSDKFKERLCEYDIKDYNNSIIFLDLKDSYSDKFIDEFLIRDIAGLIKDKNIINNQYPSFILLVEDLEGSLTYDNLFLSHFENHPILNHCFVFDKNGKFINKETLDIKHDPTLIDLVNLISKSSLEKFDFKLVRKINHFIRKENKQWTACQHFFYEIINDEGDEVFQLLKDELYLLNVNPHYIIYDTRHSEWLASSIIAFSNTISSGGFDGYSNYKDSNIIDINEKWDSAIIKKRCDIIFISDLIHTGTTFRNSYKKIYKKFPNSNISCLSALVTEYAFDKKAGVEDDRKITINDTDIRFFKKVKQKFAYKSANRIECPLCKYNLLPPVETSSSISKDLSAYEMWLMSEEAGYKIEDFPPRGGREKMIIPNSLELFKRNGSLLALKFQKHINDLGIYANEIVIVFPDERKAILSNGTKQPIEDTPSGYFAKCLKFYNNNYNYLGIPREMIRQLDEAKEPWDHILQKFPDIIKQIEDIDENNPIIIMDEVNITGRTFKTIADILGNLGKNTTSYFPIFNFNSSGTDILPVSSEGRYKDIYFLNLYQFELTYETN